MLPKGRSVCGERCTRKESPLHVATIATCGLFTKIPIWLPRQVGLGVHCACLMCEDDYSIVITLRPLEDHC